MDPTTAMIESQNNERAQLRVENQQLRDALATALDERDAARVVEHVRDEAFVAGYEQAVREIRDRFAKAGDFGVVHVIETTWLKRSS